MSSKSKQYNRNKEGRLKSITETTRRSDGSTFSKTTAYPSGKRLNITETPPKR